MPAERRATGAPLALVLAAVAVGSVGAASRAQADVRAIASAFAPHDLDGDGRAEVRRIEVIGAAGDTSRPLVVVLVEGRAWRWMDPLRFERSFKRRLDLPDVIARFGSDLRTDGFRTLTLAVDVHSGPPHQDGRTVLGLRRLLQRLHAAAPLAGAVLVGHFPDALLVRTCNWYRNEPLTLPGKDGKPVAIDAKTTNVRAVPEIVAHRCDLVLADLDGDWERLYVPGPASLVSATGVFGDTVPPAGGPCVALHTAEQTFTDVFHVRDGAAIADRDAFTLHLDAADRDHECTAADRARGNPMARPDIAVSRIDARGVAWKPSFSTADPLWRWPHYEGELAFAPSPSPEAPTWCFNHATENALLVDYFERNHAFRTQPLAAERRRPASIAHGLGSGMAAMRAADPAWAAFADEGYDVAQGADLLALYRWLQRPAVLRTLRAHSDPWAAVFAASDDVALERELGAPEHWVKDGDRFVPSWREHRGGRADFGFYRALSGRKELRDNPYLLVHTGCEALSPPHAVACAYDDPRYGQRAHAESMLFFTPCLAIVGRAKVFYDEPREFAATLGAGRTFGDAWRRYFAVESAAASWDEVGGDIGRKRAYFWSVVGDWTLRLPKAP